ncbi:cystatin-C [Aulostomus maculatus]
MLYKNKIKVTLPLSVLILLPVMQLCVGEQLVDEVIVTKKVPVLGGWFERNVDSIEVKEAALYALKMYNAHAKGRKMFRLVSITSAKSQVTNMINYKIDAVLGKTKCLKSENHELDKCAMEKKHLKCRFMVTLNPRNNKLELQSHKCQSFPEKV